MKTTDDLEEQIEALEIQLQEALEALWRELMSIKEVIKAMRDPK